MSAVSILEKHPRPARILVVEDSNSDVRLLEKALQARDIAYELTVYEDGERAIRLISSDHTLTPDLILVDLNLPRREGFDVLRTVFSMPRLSGVPVAVLSSSRAAKDRGRTEIMGVTRYIPKPGTLDEFIEEVGLAVMELLRRAPATDDSRESKNSEGPNQTAAG
jgi:two-component system, chemotaxis family, response regulator Rcp1